MRLVALFLLASFAVTASHAQQDNAQTPPIAPAATEASTSLEAKLIPDITTLMRDVEEHQRTAEALRRQYLYHTVTTEEDLDGKGNIKKTTVEEHDIFYMEGVPVDKLTRKDGKDLTPDEQEKEDKRIDKVVREAKEKRAKREAKGEATDSQGDEVITLSRILELGSFSNPRREIVNGRSTIFIDYKGDPNAKSHTTFESIMKQIAGTLSVDEETRAVVSADGHFVDNFHIGGGLVANVQKGFHFHTQQVYVNNELWLPSEIDAAGSARILLFLHINGRIRANFSNYRKFRASATILPATTPAPSDDQSSPATSPSIPPPTPPQ